MDFLFGFPADTRKNNGIHVFVDLFNKKVNLVAETESITSSSCAHDLSIPIFCLYGLPRDLVSNQAPRSTTYFWRYFFNTLTTHLKMSKSNHPVAYGQA